MIEANPDRLLWGSDWPHTGMWHDIDRLMEELEPFHPVDDGKALNLMNRWIADAGILRKILADRSEEHTSELQSLMRISYAVFCLKKNRANKKHLRIKPL